MYPSQGNRNVSTESRKSNIVRYDAYSRGNLSAKIKLIYINLICPYDINQEKK